VNAPLDETAADRPDVVQLQIPAKAEWVAVARLAAAGVASRLDFSVEDIEDVKLAIAEACTICIRRGVAGGRIEIVTEAGPAGLRAIVRGEAGNQRQLTVADADDALALVIVESLMDSVHLRSEGGSSIVEMVKRVAPTT
jgi:serine/threonine-protein kinase RsbW